MAGPPSPLKPAGAVSRDGADYTVRVHHANSVIEIVCNIEVACRIDGNAVRKIELSRRGGTSVPAEPGKAVACDGVDQTIPSYHAYTIIPVRDVKVACSVHGNGMRRIQPCRGCQAFVPTKTQLAVACDSTHNAIRRDPADAMIPIVGDEHVPDCIHGNTDRPVNHCGRRQATIPAKASSTLTGEDTDHTARRYFVNDVAVVIGDVENTCRVDGNVNRGPVPQIEGANQATGGYLSQEILAVEDEEIAGRIYGGAIRIDLDRRCRVTVLAETTTIDVAGHGVYREVCGLRQPAPCRNTNHRRDRWHQERLSS